MKKTSNIIIRVDEDVKNKFQQLVDSYDINMSSLLNAYMIDMINNNAIPGNILSRIKPTGKPALSIVSIKKAVEEIVTQSELRRKIRKIYLFGDYARGEENVTSVIKLRVEHENGFDLYDLSELSLSLKKRLGAEINIISQEITQMDRSLYESIKKEEICIYESK